MKDSGAEVSRTVSELKVQVRLAFELLRDNFFVNVM